MVVARELAAVHRKGGCNLPSVQEVCLLLSPPPVAHLSQTTEAVPQVHKRQGVCAPTSPEGGQQTIVPPLGRLSAQADVVRLDAVGLEIECTVGIVERTANKGISYGLSPVLPPLVQIVVVVIVHTAYLVGDGGIPIVIDRTGLVRRVQVFVDDGSAHGIVGQGRLNTDKAVPPSIFEEHHRVVLEVVVVVGAQPPPLALVAQTEEPAAHGVARGVGIGFVGGITPRAGQGVPKGFQSMVHLQFFRIGAFAARGVVDSTAELARHLQSALEHQGEAVLVAYPQIARLAVIQGFLGIVVAGIYIVLLPIAVGHDAVAHVSLDGCPIAATRDGEIVGHLETDLRDGACVGAQRHGAAAQQGMLEGRLALLDTCREAHPEPFHLGVRLCRDDVAAGQPIACC